MTLEGFASMASARGWKCIGSNAYGVHRNYPFSLYYNGGRVTSLTATFRLKRSVSGKIVRPLNKSLPKGCSILQPQQGVFNLVCAGADEVLEGNLRTGMDAVTAALAEGGYGPPDICPYCKQRGCDALAAQGGAGARPGPNTSNVVMGAVVGGAVGAALAQSFSTPATGYVPVHRTCVQDRAAEGTASAHKSLVEGSYGKGLLGAVLGALVGALPTILFQAFTYSYLALLSILIPLAAWFGYKKLGGKRTMGAFAVVAVVSLFCTLFVVDQAVFYLMFVQEGIWPNVLESVPYFYSYYYMEDIILDLLYPLLWTVIGLVGVFGQCRKSKAVTTIEDAGVALESLQSYTPRGEMDL